MERRAKEKLPDLIGIFAVTRFWSSIGPGCVTIGNMHLSSCTLHLKFVSALSLSL
jgi:hypothetical protein